jgi:hypothetical protein
VPSGLGSARSHNDGSRIVPRTSLFFKLDFLSLFQPAEIKLLQATAMEEYLPPIFGTDEPEPVGVVYCFDSSVHPETSVRLDGLDARTRYDVCARTTSSDRVKERVAKLIKSGSRQAES